MIMKTTGLPIPGRVRPRTSVIAALFGSGAAVVAFCTLVSLYVQQRQQTRSAGEEWFPVGSIEMGPAGMMMMTLALSVVAVQWAVQAAHAEDRPHGFMALGVTLLLGAAVLNQFWFIYQDTGLVVDESNAALLFYAVTGSFLAMLVVAMMMIAAITARALLGTFNSGLAHTIQATAIFWHAVVLCYCLVWYIVFITK